MTVVVNKRRVAEDAPGAAVRVVRVSLTRQMTPDRLPPEDRLEVVRTRVRVVVVVRQADLPGVVRTNKSRTHLYGE